jgi:hypothetical protein
MPTASTTPDWNRLDRAAAAFWKLAPWTLTELREMLAIEHPTRGRLFVVTEEVSMYGGPGVYVMLGSTALEYFEIFRETVERRQITDFVFRQDFILLAVRTDDIPLRRTARLPALRTLMRPWKPVAARAEPGRELRTLNAQEVDLLATALEISLERFARLRSDSEALEREEDETMLTLVSDGDGWREEWRTVVDLMMFAPIARMDMRPSWRTVLSLPSREEVWEYGVFYVEVVEEDGEHVTLHLIAGPHGELLVSELDPRRDAPGLCELLVHAMMMAGRRPAVVVVDDHELFRALTAIVGEFDIEVELEEMLPNLTGAYETLARTLAGLPAPDGISDESAVVRLPDAFRHRTLRVRYVPFERTDALSARERERIGRVQARAFDDPVKGVKDIRALAARYPDDPSIRSTLAAALLNAEEFEEAAEVMLENYARFPRHVPTIGGYCDLKLLQGEIEAALAAYDGCTELPDFFPDRTEFHVSEVVVFHAMYARILRALGRDAEAGPHRELVEIVAPGHPLLEEI